MALRFAWRAIVVLSSWSVVYGGQPTSIEAAPATTEAVRKGGFFLAGGCSTCADVTYPQEVLDERTDVGSRPGAWVRLGSSGRPALHRFALDMEPQSAVPSWTSHRRSRQAPTIAQQRSVFFSATWSSSRTTQGQRWSET